MLAQKTNGTLRSEVDTLKKEIVALKLERKSGDSSESEEAEIKHSLTRLANFFQLFHTLVVTVDAFKNPKPKFLPNDPERYEDDNALLGTTSELYAVLPEKYMAYIVQYKSLSKEFIKSISAGRSSSILRLRSHASQIFTDLGQPLFVKSVRRSEDARIRKLLAIPDDPLARKNWTPLILPPVLFENEDTSNLRGLFRNPILFTIGRLIVYGPTAANVASDKLGKLSHRVDSPYVQDGELPRATFGFIAWIATMTRFILSDDTEFNASGIGNVTNIKYLESHEYYKRVLIEGMANPKLHQSFVDLINLWNGMVFPQGIFEIIPDSQTVSAIGDEAFNTGNFDSRFNPDVTAILRQLSLLDDSDDESGTNPAVPSNPDSDDDSDNIYLNDEDPTESSVTIHSPQSTVIASTTISLAPPNESVAGAPPNVSAAAIPPIAAASALVSEPTPSGPAAVNPPIRKKPTRASTRNTAAMKATPANTDEVQQTTALKQRTVATRSESTGNRGRGKAAQGK